MEAKGTHGLAGESRVLGYKLGLGRLREMAMGGFHWLGGRRPRVDFERTLEQASRTSIMTAIFSFCSI